MIKLVAMNNEFAQENGVRVAFSAFLFLINLLEAQLMS